MARWGVFWRKLETRVLQNATALVDAACRLHNLCVEQRMPIRTGARASNGAHKGDTVTGGFQDVAETNHHRSDPLDGIARASRAKEQHGQERRRDQLRDALAMHDPPLRRPRSAHFQYAKPKSLASRARAAAGKDDAGLALLARSG